MTSSLKGEGFGQKMTCIHLWTFMNSPLYPSVVSVQPQPRFKTFITAEKTFQTRLARSKFWQYYYVILYSILYSFSYYDISDATSPEQHKFWRSIDCKQLYNLRTIYNLFCLLFFFILFRLIFENLRCTVQQ